ncbi:MAG: DUF2953 domain-containing protein [Nanohaloarchaea archaeon]|nr:DUF2953 domain-containing protein [Candidatus Nanohaloarchaea archaeon]
MALLLTVLILILILVTLSILFSPFHIGLYVEKTRPTAKADLDFIWFWKTFRLRFRVLKNELSIYLFGKRIRTMNISSGNEKKKRKEKVSSKDNSISVPPIDLIRSLLKLSIEVLRTFSLEKIYLKIDIGTDDPATTGMIAGYVHTLKSIIANRKIDTGKTTITIQPYFNEERYDIKGELKIKSQLKNYIVPLLRFMLSRPVKTVIKNKIFR